MSRGGRGAERNRSIQPRAPQQASPKAGVALSRAEFSASFSGPLPPPEVLAHYSDCIPDGADRILRMAEAQQQHRMSLERFALRSDWARSFAGLVAGLIVALLFLYVSWDLISTGHDLAGTALGTVDIVALVGVFIYGDVSRRAERTEKAKMMAGQPTE